MDLTAGYESYMYVEQASHKLIQLKTDIEHKSAIVYHKFRDLFSISYMGSNIEASDFYMTANTTTFTVSLPVYNYLSNNSFADGIEDDYFSSLYLTFKEGISYEQKLAFKKEFEDTHLA